MFFSDKKKMGGAAVGRVAADGTVKDEYADGGGGGAEEDEILHTVADELVTAVHAKDVKGVTAALRAFLACCQAMDEVQDDQEG